jgi:hypothetical protein
MSFSKVGVGEDGEEKKEKEKKEKKEDGQLEWLYGCEHLM